ncbi:hypothetical protein C8R43DRAFT_996763 [Mycena crocata]|nr:hypothetical protein C8R43DRAFT_996763 [Mycena crocata]
MTRWIHSMRSVWPLSLTNLRALLTMTSSVRLSGSTSAFVIFNTDNVPASRSDFALVPIHPAETIPIPDIDTRGSAL